MSQGMSLKSLLKYVVSLPFVIYRERRMGVLLELTHRVIRECTGFALEDVDLLKSC